jgi:hypothetical protein
MAVIEWISLGVADTVRVMTDGAGRIFFNNMLIMLRKTLIPQDAAPAVAFIADGIIRGTLHRVVEGYIVSLEQKLKGGAVWA